MADNYIVDSTDLTSVADAIRTKGGTSDPLSFPDDFVSAVNAISGGGGPVIEALDVTANGTYTAPDGVDGYSPVTVNVPQDGSPPDEAFVLSGECSYRFANGGWDWFLEQYENRITTSNITNANSLFSFSKIYSIPFEINLGGNIFYLKNMFDSCYYLRDLPIVNVPETPYWTTVTYSNVDYIFRGCYSLRKIREENKKFLQNIYTKNYICSSQMFSACYALDEIDNFPVGNDGAKTSNNFTSVFSQCNHLKNITFMTDNGVPYTRSWKSQTIDLSSEIGYGKYSRNFCDYNSGIKMSKQVTDDATYQALKNDPDWFTTNVAYSRYNHDSAVATINSLPDTSAYLASAGGTNTIKFKGEAGSATDGGAINTLTESEIAVATAKGWTVTFV